MPFDLGLNAKRDPGPVNDWVSGLTCLLGCQEALGSATLRSCPVATSALVLWGAGGREGVLSPWCKPGMSLNRHVIVVVVSVLGFSPLSISDPVALSPYIRSIWEPQESNFLKRWSSKSLVHELMNTFG